MPSKLHDHVAPPGVTPVFLTEEQYQGLVELLTPGYELASLMLADYKAKAAEAAERSTKELDHHPV